MVSKFIQLKLINVEIKFEKTMSYLKVQTA